jgi:serine/threonine protein kinase/formylglycine-generating enzyme required for sulfatase activity
VTAPTDIEEFRLVRMLGRGGMGTVYLAHDSILDRPVALKIVSGVSEDTRLRFLIEARAIARLHHPNVVAIYRAGTTTDGEPYLIQELIRGQPLDRLPRPMPASRCLALATGVARGLAAAHRRGVLHRDVKPSNIMIDELGTPRLLDFGIAKLSGMAEVPPAPVAAPPGSGRVPPSSIRVPSSARVVPSTPALDDTAELPAAADASPASAAAVPVRDDSPEPMVAHGTRAGTILGTPRYMAPEMWRGDSATARSDLYALGVVMYELLSGEPPFAENDADALRDAVLGGSPRPIGERVADLDPALAQLVMRCLAREPAARPESADEVVDQLERIASGAATIPEGNPYRGLAPFEAEQRAVFFGRGSEIAAVVDRLRSESFVVVAGDSGIGKSSLCRAGVLPAIAGGALGDGRRWTVRTGTLGRRPSAALAELLGVPALPVDAGETGLAPQLGRQLALGADRGLLIFADQLEELVTQAALTDATAAAAVLAALGDGIPGVKVLVTVRGDFLTRVAALPSLREVMTRSLHLVRGLSADDARDVVVAPARAKGVAFETRAMVDELVHAILDRPAALPLLSFALSELWARRDLDRAIIPARALEEIGGVVGALASHADRVVTSLAEPERAHARRILLALVTIDETRASRSRAELVADDPVAARALEALVSGRLVAARDVADGEPVYELAHESLLAAWGTLQGWLDDAAGQRGIRTRLAAAAAEWTRLGQPRELLWRRRQLAEAAQLDHVAPADRRFLAASRRATRLRLALTVAIAAAIPAAAGGTWLGLAMRDEAQRDRELEARLAEVDEFLGYAELLADHARHVRSGALALFDHKDDEDDETAVAAVIAAAPGELRWLEALAALGAARPGFHVVAEARWSEAGAVFGAARNTLRLATSQVEATLLAGGNLPHVRRAMAGAIYRHALIAEEVGDQPAVDELVQRLGVYDDSYLDLWHATIPIALTAIGATRIDVRRYIEESDRLVLSPHRTVVEGDRVEMALRRGSYLAEVHAPEIAPVLQPFVVARNAPVTIEIALPRPGQVPPEMIYIPPGAFQTGSNAATSFRNQFQRCPPLHSARTGAYLIARNEVRFGDWLDYLRQLDDDERKLRQQSEPRGAQGSVLLEGGPTRFKLVLTPATVEYEAWEGQPIRYQERSRREQVEWERLPASGITFPSALAYAAWLAKTGRVPNARLCSNAEWERAARGADDRSFPTGDALQADDANIDATYGRRDGGFGPDEVGAYPASQSPFGVLDLTGNAVEWVVGGDRGNPNGWVRGGSWYHGSPSAEIPNLTDMNEDAVFAFLGIRICADLAD